MAIGDSDPKDTTYIITQGIGKDTENKFYRRPTSLVWNYIKSKADSVYLGKSATAVAATKATQDASGNTITSTYATKTELNNKVDKVSGKGLSTNDYTTAEKNKLAGIAAGANVNQNAFSNVAVGSTTIAADTTTDTLTLVAGSNVTITPDATNDKITISAVDTKYTLPFAGSSLGGVKSGGDVTIADGVITVNDDSHAHVISNVDGLQDALDGKVPSSRTVNGKALSANISLTASDVGAATSGHTHSSYVNQNAFSNVKVGDTTVAADTTTDTLTLAAGSNITLTPDATNDKVTIAVTGLATVATSGKYSDLSGKPTIPAAANNGTLTIQKNGSNVATFGANQSTNTTANITVPTKTSDITNDSGFITSSAIPTSLKNPKALTFGSKTYDGSSAVTLSASDLGLEQAMKFIGTTTTAISDGSTTGTITVNDKNITVTAGNVVLYGGYEYVWIGSAWEQLGQEGSFSLKTHKHTVTHTPAGTISTPAITVTPNTTTVNSITAVGSLPSLTYTEGKASKITAWSAGTAPSLSFSKGTLPSATFTAGSGSASLAGSVTSTGPNRTATLTFSHTHTAPSLSFSAGTLPSATFSAGSVPSLTYSEVNADDITEWSSGSLPTKGSNTTVVTSIKSATSTQPTFTGTAATLTTTAADT